MERKYEFTGKERSGLKQIRRIADGVIGGWIEGEHNLSHNGNAWVYVDARVCGNAWVYGNAEMYGDARVCGNAEVYGNARVCGNARVSRAGDYWSLSGLEFPATYTKSDNSLAIGCQRHTVDEWKNILEHGNYESAPLLEAALRAMFADTLTENLAG